MLYLIFRWAITTLFGGVLVAFVAEAILARVRPTGFLEHPFALVTAGMSWILALPGIWYFVVLTGSLTVGMWLDTLARKRAIAGLKSEPIVREWLPAAQAKEKFVEPKLLTDLKAAEERLRVISQTPAASDFIAHERERSDAEFLAKHRLEDVVESLRIKLKDGELVAKGLEVKNGKIRDFESYLPRNMWGVLISGAKLIDFETGVVTAYFGTYRSVLFGRNEAFQKK